LLLAHRRKVEISIIDQCQVNLPAHRGNIGLVEQQNWAAFKRKAPPKRGKTPRENTPMPSIFPVFCIS
jgi:hypothetical protein